MSALLARMPFAVLLGLFGALGYIAYDYHSFQTDPDSPLNRKKASLTTVQTDVEKLKKRLKEVENFRKSLDAKRQELRKLAMELDETRAILSEDLDVAGFMRSVISEAQHSGLTVSSLKPGQSSKLEFVMQQTFVMTFSGVYAQILGFIDRLSKLQKIVKIEDYDLKPLSGKANQRFVELKGQIQIQAYRYLGTKADDLAKSNGAAQDDSPTGGKPEGAGP